MREAAGLGPSVELLCHLILEDRPHPEQGFRSCRGIVSLGKGFGAKRLDAACLRALEIGARSYGPVRSILDKKLDGQPVQRLRGCAAPVEPEPETTPHINIRGSEYYH